MKIMFGKALTTTTIMMKAIVQNGFGPPQQVLQLTQVPKPILKKSTDILVRVHATSINTPDWVGTYGIPYVMRPIMGGLLCRARNRIRGNDVAGIVEQVGSQVDHVQVGDEVFGSIESLSGGAFAEYAIVSSKNIIKKPKQISMEEAAGAVMSGITARAAIYDSAKIKKGDHILINGASGSIGTFCIQMAKSQGAIVTGVCSTRNVDLIKSLGADHVIDYTKEDYTQGETRYDMILDNVMNHPYKESQKVLKDNGFIIPNSAGTTRSKFWGAIPQLLFKPKNSPYVACEATRENLQHVADLLASRKVKVVIDKVYSFEQTPEAVEYMASHHAKGNVLVKVKQY